MELWSGNTKAIIDPIGGWMTNLSDEYGDVLFPKRSLKTADGGTKVRGGCHVCLPNFGPGGDSSQPQHGYGRTSQWQVSGKTRSSALLTLASGEGGYEGVSAKLSYQLTERELAMRLTLANGGDTTLEVAPAFHPYFSLNSDEATVAVDDEVYQLDELADTGFIDGNAHALKTMGRSFELYSDELRRWALWTDRLGAYVCVEPTENGFAFAERLTKKQLKPNQEFSWNFTLKW